MIEREVWRRKGRERRTSTTVGAFHVGPVLVRTLSFSSTGLHMYHLSHPDNHGVSDNL